MCEPGVCQRQGCIYELICKTSESQVTKTVYVRESAGTPFDGGAEQLVLIEREGLETPCVGHRGQEGKHERKGKRTRGGWKSGQESCKRVRMIEPEEVLAQSQERKKSIFNALEQVKRLEAKSSQTNKPTDMVREIMDNPEILGVEPVKKVKSNVRRQFWNYGNKHDAML